MGWGDSTLVCGGREKSSVLVLMIDFVFLCPSWCVCVAVFCRGSKLLTILFRSPFLRPQSCGPCSLKEFRK